MDDNNLNETFESSQSFKIYVSSLLILGSLFVLIFTLIKLQDETPLPILFIFTMIFVGGIINFFKKHKRLMINLDGISVNGKFHSWDLINTITYARDSGNGMLQVIEVVEGKIITYIYPSTFKDGENIGILISKLAEKYDIKVVFNNY